jgi:hypothetical protein
MSILQLVRFQVLTAASMMFRVVFWDILPCKIIVNRRFRGGYCLLWNVSRQLFYTAVYPRRQIWTSCSFSVSCPHLLHHTLPQLTLHFCTSNILQILLELFCFVFLYFHVLLLPKRKINVVCSVSGIIKAEKNRIIIYNLYIHIFIRIHGRINKFCYL